MHDHPHCHAHRAVPLRAVMMITRDLLLRWISLCISHEFFVIFTITGHRATDYVANAGRAHPCDVPGRFLVRLRRSRTAWRAEAARSLVRAGPSRTWASGGSS